MRGFPRKPRFARPVYYITSVLICQGVFEKFFKNFSWFFRTKPQPLGGSARLLYHIFLILSRGFSKVFSTFFVIFFGKLLFRSARLLYHIFLILSRGFSKVFSTFFMPFRDRSGPVRGPCLSASRAVLAYYSTSLPICQGVFVNFFTFGSLGSLA